MEIPKKVVEKVKMRVAETVKTKTRVVAYALLSSTKYLVRWTVVVFASLMFAVYGVASLAYGGHTSLYQLPGMATWLLRLIFIYCLLGNFVYVFGELVYNIVMGTAADHKVAVVSRFILRYIACAVAVFVIMFIEIGIYKRKLCFGFACPMTLQYYLKKGTYIIPKYK